MFYMWFAYVWHLSLGNPRCVCSMCFVCVFETVYVYVWAGYSNTGSIVEAFGILIKLGACWRPCKSPLHGCMYETDELVVYETIVVCLPSRPRVDNSHMPPWDSSWVTCMFLIPWRKEAHCGHSEPWQNVGWPSWRWAHPTHMRPSPRKKKLFNLSTEKDVFLAVYLNMLCWNIQRKCLAWQLLGETSIEVATRTCRPYRSFCARVSGPCPHGEFHASMSES